MKFKNLRAYLIVAGLVALGLILLLNKVLIAGLIMLGIGGIIFSMWEFFLKEKEKQLDELAREMKRIQTENNALKQDLDELSRRRLNITEVNEILELGLIEVDTSFKRTVNRNLEIDRKQVQFIGVLHVDFVAKYGIDFKKLKYRIDEEKQEISIANAIPQFLSFSKRNCVWEIAEILEYNEPFFGGTHWKTNAKLDKLANQLKEEIRVKTERETENGPRELDWITRPLQKHVETALELILGNRGYKIRITELDSGDYKPIQEYNAKAIPER